MSKVMTEEEQFQLPAKAIHSKAVKLLNKHLQTEYSEQLVEDIKSSYSESYRYYHNWQHVEEIIASHFKWYGEPQYAFLETAIWHDVIYVPGSKTNEKFSSALYTANTPILRDNRVNNVIEASANHWNRPKGLPEWAHQFLDMDLIGFVENPRRNSAKVYQEFKPFFDMNKIIAGRRTFFNTIIASDNFYYTLPKEVSQKAIENIRLELEQLEKIKGTHTFYLYYKWLLDNDKKAE